MPVPVTPNVKNEVNPALLKAPKKVKVANYIPINDKVKRNLFPPSKK